MLKINDMMKKFSTDPNAKVRFLDTPKFTDHFLAMDASTAYRMKVPHEAACPVCIKDYEKLEPEQVPYGARTGFLINALKPRDPPEFVTVTVPRKHRKRSNQTEAYHRKVQKRWYKRGLKVIKQQEVMDPIQLKLGQATMHKLRSAVMNKRRGVRVEGSDLHVDLDAVGLVFKRKNNA